ncbi:MAG: hypothetical protein ABSB75_07415, partial [Candidatus Limnocylindrales bacterium]
MRAAGLNDRRGRTAARAIAAAVISLATLLVAALHEHDPYDIHAGLAAQVVAGLVPLLAAALAGTCVLRPRVGFVAVLLLTPVVNVAQVCWLVVPVQVIAQTVFVVALGVG